MKSVTKSMRAAQAAAPEFFGATVQGPLHKKHGRPCEDAWKGKEFAGSAAIAISDGMGSKAFAARGAKAACLAAIRVARAWATSPSVGPEWICRWLEAQWRFAVAPHEPQECAATCHLIAMHQEAGLVYTGLGDGMALFQEGSEPVRSLSARRLDGFANETLALGVNHRLADWTQAQIPLPQAPWIAVLVTDGIADDLRPDKLDAFVKWLRDEIGRKPKNERLTALRRALREWPTPGHLDDKTLAVLLSA
jgi:hypothetical protein